MNQYFVLFENTNVVFPQNPNKMKWQEGAYIIFLFKLFQ